MGMDIRRFAPRVLLGLTALVGAGCSFLSFVTPATHGAGAAPLKLDLCGSYPEALCLESFGLSQGDLLITLFFPAAGDSQFYLKVWQGDSAATYPCIIAAASPSTVYCTGPLINLGTAIKIDLYTETGDTPLAHGEFTLTGLALPTVPSGIVLTAVPTPPLPVAGAAYPNPTPP